MRCFGSIMGSNAMTHTAGFNAGIEAAGPFWCVHIIGPDDIHAAPDFETAWAWAEAANKVIAPHADERDVLWRCTVAIWPGDATSHAEDLKRGGRNDVIDFPALVETLKCPEPSEAEIKVCKHSGKPAPKCDAHNLSCAYPHCLVAADKVERLAMWLFQHHQEQLYPITWDRAAEIGKDWFRQRARAALAAMSGEG